MMSCSALYRDRIYVVKDIILNLVDYSKKKTTLASNCRLNLKKHKYILDDLEANDLISRSEILFGKRMVTFYQTTQKGIEFYRRILEPYEKMFPRRITTTHCIHHEEKSSDTKSAKGETIQHQPLIAGDVTIN
jgi:predicted transcriptional regulator